MKTDVVKEIGATIREVRRAEREGQVVHVVVATRAYDTSVEDLWEALTNPDRIKRWFLPLTGDLEVGGRYQLQGNAGGEILECEKPNRLSVTWVFGTQTSWLAVSLAPDGKRTRLVLEHTVPQDAHFEKFGPGAVGVGWDLTLHGLALHLGDPDKPIDMAEAMAWMGSENGKEMMSASAEDWGRAFIASGHDEAKARTTSANTAAFYRGETPPGES